MEVLNLYCSEISRVLRTVLYGIYQKLMLIAIAVMCLESCLSARADSFGDKTWMLCVLGLDAIKQLDAVLGCTLMQCLDALRCTAWMHLDFVRIIQFDLPL